MLYRTIEWLQLTVTYYLFKNNYTKETKASKQSNDKEIEILVTLIWSVHSVYIHWNTTLYFINMYTYCMLMKYVLNVYGNQYANYPDLIWLWFIIPWYVYQLTTLHALNFYNYNTGSQGNRWGLDPPVQDGFLEEGPAHYFCFRLSLGDSNKEYWVLTVPRATDRVLSKS